MKRMFGTGRYANITATLALVIALGGTSYAAIILPADSVGTTQLKKRAVTASRIRPSAVTSVSVRNRTLRAVDFKAGQLPAGPAGPAGATKVVRRLAVSEPVAPGALTGLALSCNLGERAITGGLQGDPVQPPAANIFTVTDSFPTATTTVAGDVPTGWYVNARNTSNAPNQFRAFIVCVQP